MKRGEKERRRVNISVSPDVYNALVMIQHSHGFRSPCEVVVSMVNVMTDRIKKAEQRVIDIPGDDGAYIDQMFHEFAYSQKTPAGNPPKRTRVKR